MDEDKNSLLKETLKMKESIFKSKRINICLASIDYHDRRVKDLEKGVPYQTLISSINHSAASRNGICLMEYGICKTNLKYLDAKNLPSGRQAKI